MAMAKRQKIEAWNFPHLDKRIEEVLGHFRKDFEGVLSPERLGPMFGCYGSFLPAYKIQQTQGVPKAPTLLPPKATTYYTARPVSTNIAPRFPSLLESAPAKAVEKIRLVEKEPQKPARIGTDAAYYRRSYGWESGPEKADERYHRSAKRSLERDYYQRQDDERERPWRISSNAGYYRRRGFPAKADEKIWHERAAPKRSPVRDEQKSLRIRIVFGSEKRAQKKSEGTR